MKIFKFSSRKVKRFFPHLVLLLPVILFFSRTILQGKYFFAFDALRDFYPWNAGGSQGVNNFLITDPIFHLYLEALQFHEGVRAGFLPFWRDDLFCGTPFLLFWQSVPKVLLYGLFPVLTASSLLLASHLYLSGVFSYLYLRRQRLAVLSSLTGALAWMFNGYVMVWFEFEFAVMFAAALPAALWLIDRALSRRRLLDWLLVALVNAYAIAIIFPLLMYYYFMCSGAYMVFSLWRKGLLRYGWRLVFRLLASYGGAVILAMVGTVGFWVVAAGQFGGAQRVAFVGQELYFKTGQVFPEYLLTMLHPELFGTPVQRCTFIPEFPGQDYNNYNELCVYAGVVVLMLALTSLWRPLKKNTLFFLLVAGFSLWGAMGCVFYPYFARLIPGLAFSTPTRLLFLTGFSVAMLSAYGMQLLLYARRRWRLAIFPLAVFALLLVVLWLANSSDCGRLIFGRSAKIHMEILKNFIGWDTGCVQRTLSWGGMGCVLIVAAVFSRCMCWRKKLLVLAMVVAVAEILLFGWRYNTVCTASEAFPATPGKLLLDSDNSVYRIAATGNLGGENCFSAWGLESVGGYASVLPRRYEQFFNMAMTGWPNPDKVGKRWLTLQQFSMNLLSLANVRYLFSSKAGLETVPPHLELIYKDEMCIYRNKACLPRVLFVGAAELAETDMEAAMKMCRFRLGDFLERVVIQRDDLDFMPPENRKIKPFSVPVAIMARHAGYLSVSVNAPAGGWLVVANSYDSGWRVKIDDIPGRMVRANFAFQAVPVSAGAHTVVLSYEPRLVMWLTLFSYLSWGGLITVIVLLARRSKRMAGAA